MRKLLIGSITFAIVLTVYVMYNRITESSAIQAPAQSDSVDIEIPEFTGDAARVGDAVVGSVGVSEFVDYDEEKNVKHIFGYEKLLNPEVGGREWRLTKPYMNLYDKGFLQCKITSEDGTIQLEEVAGARRPSEAKLFNNVVINFYSADNPITLYMDTLNYVSSRSEFSTKGPLKLVSENILIQGTGVVFVYNSVLSRIEYLKLDVLDHMYIREAAQLSSAWKSPESAKAEVSEKPTPTTSPEPGTRPAAKAKVVEKSPPKPAAVKPTPASPDDYYNCYFSRNVNIEYGENLVVFGEDKVSVTNVLWNDGSSKTDSSANRDTAIAAGDSSADKVSTPAKSKDTSVEESRAVNNTSKVQTAPEPGSGSRGHLPGKVADDGSVDIIVTCDGSVIIKPITSHIDSGTIEGSALSDPAESEKTALEPLKNDYRDRFQGRTIDYDMITGDTLAGGPIKLTFYTDPNEADPSTEPVATVITADKNAEFLVNDERVVDRVVFNGSVIVARDQNKPAYLEKNTVRGGTMVIDLETTAEGTSDVRHLKVTGGNVQLESKRLVEDTITNHILLVGRALDYFASEEIVLVTGPGKIEVNNSNAPAVVRTGDKGPGNAMNLEGPCYAQMKGFDNLRWLIGANQVTVDGAPVTAVYQPIVDGEFGRRVDAAATHMEANFKPLPSGQNELTNIKIAGGVYYNEEAGHLFKGEFLFYDTIASFMKITGTEQEPCLLDGVRVPEIRYDMATGRIKTRLSRGGIISPPAKRKR